MEEILIPARRQLDKEDKRILLIMDGHGTHTFHENIQFCTDNGIDACFMPAHTSHILQPLDIGIFNSYKASYRRSVSDPALDDIMYNGLTEATRNRLRMLGRALIANMHAVNCKSIKRSFYRSGIYPPSFTHFLYYSHGVRDIPPDVVERVQNEIQAEKDNRSRRVNAKGRRGVVDHILIVDASEEI